MGKALAVLGCTIEITSGQQAVAMVVKTQPSQKVSVGGKGVYFGDMEVMLTGVTQGSLVCPEATLTIKGTAAKVLNADGDKAVQADDNATDKFTFTDSSSGATTSLPISIQITDAGQTDVVAL